MSQLQKYAWFNLAVAGVAVVVYLVLVPIIGPEAALGAFGVCGLWGFGGAFLREKSPAKVVWDERERMIWARSTRAGFAAFWGVFVIAAMAPFFVLGPEGSISVKILPWYVLFGMFTVWVVKSLVILLLSRRGGAHVSE